MTNQLFRDYLDGKISAPAKPEPLTLSEAIDRFEESIVGTFSSVAKAFWPITEALQSLGVIEAPPPTDPRERALWAKQHRGTGPNATPLRVRGRTTHYKEKP